MLILTRRAREKLVIFNKGQGLHDVNKIELTVLSIREGQVRIGIKAPENIIVHRDEIYQKILEEGGK